MYLGDASFLQNDAQTPLAKGLQPLRRGAPSALPFFRSLLDAGPPLPPSFAGAI